MKLGLVQMTSTNTHDGNIQTAETLVAEAAQKGCDLIAFPEVAGLMNSRIEAARADIKTEAEDPYIRACQDLARAHEIWIHTGSTPVIQDGETRFFNHSNMIDATGQITARYDKIHLFDMFPDNAPPIQESKRYAPGRDIALADTPWGSMGMSICYDLRFPHLYRTYAQQGATCLFVPSAFTVPTGRAHWELLLRARAIENGAFVIAPAQVGTHDDGRVTYGHSMVVDPWGKILMDMEERVGLATLNLEIEDVARARARIPSLTHGHQKFELSEIEAKRLAP